MPLKRFSMVPVDSSAARIPLPDATIARAILARSFIVASLLAETCVESRNFTATRPPGATVPRVNQSRKSSVDRPGEEFGTIYVQIATPGDARRGDLGLGRCCAA